MGTPKGDLANDRLQAIAGGGIIVGERPGEKPTMPVHPWTPGQLMRIANHMLSNMDTRFTSATVSPVRA